MPEIYTFGPEHSENLRLYTPAPAERVASTLFPGELKSKSQANITNKTSCSDHNISFGKDIEIKSNVKKNTLKLSEAWTENLGGLHRPAWVNLD